MARTNPSDFTVLVVDDERNIRRTLRLVLEGEGYMVAEAAAAEEIGGVLAVHSVDCMVLDIILPDEDGLSALKRLRQEQPQIPVLMISGHASIADAVEATRLGAVDFLEKPLDRDRVLIAIRNAIERVVLQQRVEALAARAMGPADFDLIGESQVMSELKAAIAKVAPTAGRVLISGESGTGKELVARSLHLRSRRAGGPFVKVNCAAIPPGLIESELFGHERGAFSGAERRKRGLFEIADGGTVFLDEIGDMALAAQAKVLRVLQFGELTRVGGEHTLTVDVRVIAATNSNLEDKVRAGTFREDLYYRLAVVPMETPPLRLRLDDVPLLARAFCHHFSIENGSPEKRLDDDVLKLMQRYRWPGNVRELRNLCERLVIMGGDPISRRDLPREFQGPTGASLDLSTLQGLTLKRARGLIERELIRQQLEQLDWNVTRTAEMLGIERTNLHKKMKLLDLRRDENDG